MNYFVTTAVMSTEQQDARISQAVIAYRRRLFDFIRARVRVPADAEDILQDVFAELASSFRLLQPVEQTAAWLFRVARNKITDRYRKHKPALIDDLRPATLDAEESEGSFMEELLGSGDDMAFKNFDNSLIRETLLAALEELPAEQRDVFMRNEIDQESFREISEETGVPVNTLLSRKHYAVKFLRRRMVSLYTEVFGELPGTNASRKNQQS